MKISQEEIEAALVAYSNCTNDLDAFHRPSIIRSIEAAYRVRKERKKQKRGDKSSILDADQQEAIKAALDPDEVAAVQTAYDQFVAAQYIPKPHGKIDT